MTTKKAAETDAKDKPTADDAGAADSKAAGASQTGGDEPKGKTYGQSEVDSLLDKVIAREKRQHEEARQAELDRLERERLKEQGEFQKLFEKEQEKRQQLEAEREHSKFVDASRATLREMELLDFEDVLLSPVKTPEDVKAKAVALKAILDKGVADGVIKKLETGQRPLKAANGTVIPAGKWSGMSQEQKLNFIKEHGADAAAKLQFDEALTAGV